MENGHYSPQILRHYRDGVPDRVKGHDIVGEDTRLGSQFSQISLPHRSSGYPKSGTTKGPSAKRPQLIRLGSSESNSPVSTCRYSTRVSNSNTLDQFQSWVYPFPSNHPGVQNI